METTMGTLKMSTLASGIKPAALDTAAAEVYTGHKPGSFPYLRWAKKGPPYVIEENTGLIRYLRADLDAWLQAGRVDPKVGPSKRQLKSKRRGGPGRPPGSTMKLRNSAPRRSQKKISK
jgi:hypothetical protein